MDTEQHPYRQEPAVEPPTARSPSWLTGYRIIFCQLAILFVMAMAAAAGIGVAVWAESEHHIHWLFAFSLCFTLVMAIFTLFVASTFKWTQP